METSCPRPRRLDALLGRRRRLVGRRDGHERASSDRLAQAETLWAMLDPPRIPAEVRGGLEQRAALLRAHLGRMVQRLASPQVRTRDQWNIKQSYARRPPEHASS